MAEKLVLRSGPLDWTDLFKDIVDLGVEQFDSLKPYLEKIWLTKLVVKITTRLIEKAQGTSAVFPEWAIPPIGWYELYKSNKILDWWSKLGWQVDPVTGAVLYSPPYGPDP